MCIYTLYWRKILDFGFTQQINTSPFEIKPIT